MTGMQEIEASVGEANRKLLLLPDMAERHGLFQREQFAVSFRSSWRPNRVKE